MRIYDDIYNEQNMPKLKEFKNGEKGHKFFYGFDTKLKTQLLYVEAAKTLYRVFKLEDNERDAGTIYRNHTAQIECDYENNGTDGLIGSRRLYDYDVCEKFWKYTTESGELCDSIDGYTYLNGLFFLRVKAANEIFLVPPRQVKFVDGKRTYPLREQLKGLRFYSIIVDKEKKELFSFFPEPKEAKKSGFYIMFKPTSFNARYTAEDKPLMVVDVEGKEVAVKNGTYLSTDNEGSLKAIILPQDAIAILNFLYKATKKYEQKYSADLGLLNMTNEWSGDVVDSSVTYENSLKLELLQVLEKQGKEENVVDPEILIAIVEKYKGKISKEARIKILENIGNAARAVYEELTKKGTCKHGFFEIISKKMLE